VELARNYHSQNNHLETVTAYNKAVEYYSDCMSGEDHGNYGTSLLDQGDRKGAIECMKIGVQKEPTNAILSFKLANIQRTSGDIQGAIVSYK